MFAAKRKRPPRLKPGMSIRSRVKVFLGVLFVFLVLYIFIGGEYGLYRIWSMKRSARILKEEIAVLQAENARLEEEKALLTSDLAYIEKIARERYGMKRKDEEVYYIEFTPAEEQRASDEETEENP